MYHWPCFAFTTVFLFCRSFHIFLDLWITQQKHECRVQKTTWGMLLQAQGWYFFFLSPFARLQYARGAMFGPCYWNPRLSTIVPCCKHAFLSHYLPWLDLLWHLLSQHYLSPMNGSPDLAVKGKALTTKSLIFVPGEINFDSRSNLEKLVNAVVCKNEGLQPHLGKSVCSLITNYRRKLGWISNGNCYFKRG